MRAKALLAIATALVANTALETPVYACATLSPEGLREFERYKARYLAEESDKRITGTFYLEEETYDEEDNRWWRVGYVDVETRTGTRRYRFYLRDVINCGFPYYYVQDGERGTFYLKKDEDPDPDDLEDGVIDDFAFVHFEPRD
ncbi:hypothetical protein [Erythrobacter dokdonensis]|uniref:Uncharacterized protein n=1 Tax=Erythrobacter dokdonensis DSW-74 TaxID=1300349 RepID=A0A1A7BL27_9SPHN|nr:hypothetical protein [Erythrobacter dokdonensis]OBV12187.1 hypothetical protein I603_0318 [Erythrobacter dokdonensis DSW-74]